MLTFLLQNVMKSKLFVCKSCIHREVTYFIYTHVPFFHPLLLFLYLAEEHCGSFKKSETPREDNSKEASNEERAVFMSSPLSNIQDFRENSTRKNNINMLIKQK